MQRVKNAVRSLFGTRRSSAASEAAAGSGHRLEQEATRLLEQGRAIPGLTELVQLCQARRHEEILGWLGRLKARPERAEGADYLRALFFLDQGQELGALEALKEEVRWFPGHSAAAELLQELTRRHPVKVSAGDPEFRELAAQVRPYTMLSEARLLSLATLARTVCAENLPGQFVECGVAAGGSSALLAALIRRHSRQPRRLFAFDTFAGMPVAGALDTHAGVAADQTGWGTGTCAAPEASVREACRQLGVEDLLVPVRGLFGDTLPLQRERIGPIALLHMDGDWYDSTRDILENLFDQVVPGGGIQVDDYGHWDGCKKAIHEFAQKHQLHFQFNRIDETGVWFRK